MLELHGPRTSLQAGGVACFFMRHQLFPGPGRALLVQLQLAVAGVSLATLPLAAAGRGGASIAAGSSAALARAGLELAIGGGAGAANWTVLPNTDFPHNGGGPLSPAIKGESAADCADACAKLPHCAWAPGASQL